MFLDCVNSPKSKYSNYGFTDAEGKTYTNLEAANNFNEFLSEIFTNKSSPLPSCALTINYDFLEEITVVCPRCISKLIEGLPYRSSPGIDGVATKLLELTEPFSRNVLALLHQQSLNEGSLPRRWRHAKVSPFHQSAASL